MPWDIVTMPFCKSVGERSGKPSKTLQARPSSDSRPLAEVTTSWSPHGSNAKTKQQEKHLSNADLPLPHLVNECYGPNAFRTA